MNDLELKKKKRISFKKIVKSLPYKAIIAFLFASTALAFGLYYIYNDVHNAWLSQNIEYCYSNQYRHLPRG